MTEQTPITEEQMTTFRQHMQNTLDEWHADVFALRAEMEFLDLSRIDDGKPRELKVAIKAPSSFTLLEYSDEVVQAYAESLKEGGAQADEETLVAALQAEHENLVGGFLAENGAGKWQHERQQGNVRLVAEEIAENVKHPVNPRDKHTRYLDSGDENEALITINDRPFHFHNLELLQDHFADVVKVRDALDVVEGEGLGKFGQVVSVVEDDVASVGNGKSLAVGRDLLAAAGRTDDEILNVLRHERGHVVHGDVAKHSERQEVFERLQGAAVPQQLFELFAESTEWSAERLADVTQNNRQAIREIQKLDAALDSIAPQVQEIAERIRSYPWYDELDAGSVAADMDNKTSLVKHLGGIPEIEDDKALATMANFYEALDPQEEEAYDDLDNDARVPQLEKLLKNLQKKHLPLMKDVQEIHVTQGYISQAQELLADMHSVIHAENPEKVADSFRAMDESMELSTGGEAGDSHPSAEQRVEAMGHFTRRILFERQRSQQQNAQGSGSISR